MRDVLSATFWTAWVVVLATNVLDTTGLLSDLYDSILVRFRARRLAPEFHVQRPNLDHLSNVGYMSNGQSSSQLFNFSFASSNLQESFANASNRDVKNVFEDVFIALESIHQKC
jgi:hypothetical protein